MGRLPLVLTAAGVLLAAQVAMVPSASAAPPTSTAEWTIPATKQASEVLTVDVIGNAAPPPGQTWDRSSVCMIFIGVDGCVKSHSENGFTKIVNADGTVTTYERSRYATYSGFTFAVYTSGGVPHVGYVDLREAASPVALVGDPDASVRPRLRVTQAVSPTRYEYAGQVLTWTSVVTNTGNVDLGHLAVTDGSSRVSARTCTPVSLGATLVVGASTTCTGTLPIVQEYLDKNADRADTVTASATTTVAGVGYKASASGSASSAPVQEPRLVLDRYTSSPFTNSEGELAIVYTVIVHNYGNVTLRDLILRAPLPGMAYLNCSSIKMGQPMAPGASTLCFAERLIGDLQPGDRTDVIKATARASTRAVNATTTFSVNVPVSPRPPPGPDAGAPVARPDVTVTKVGQPVTAGVLGDDEPRTRLVGSSIRLRLTPGLPAGSVLWGDTKSLVVPPTPQAPPQPARGGVVFLVSGQGEITVVPIGDVPAGKLTVGYQVSDDLGRTTRSTLTVTVTR